MFSYNSTEYIPSITKYITQNKIKDTCKENKAAKT